MLFGTPSDFAVEIYHEPDSSRELGFGRMRIFIQGISIGDIEEQHCSLFHAVERIGEVAEALPTLWETRFSQHTEEEIFSWLDAILFSGEISEVGEDNIHRFIFLTNTGELFDDVKTFIISPPNGSVRILFLKNDKFGSATCQAPTYVSVAASLGHWFKEQTIGRDHI